MLSFKPNFIATRALLFVNIITNSTTEGITKSHLFRLLGLCLNQCPPPSDQRVAVLNGAWKTISTLTQSAEYISCVEPWSQYISQHFSLKEINTLMGEIIAHMNINRAFENYYEDIKSIVDKIVNHTKSFEGLMTMENFLPMIDLFQKDLVKIDVAKIVMEACKTKAESNINDPVVTNALMYICKIMNDAVKYDEYVYIFYIILSQTSASIFQ